MASKKVVLYWHGLVLISQFKYQNQHNWKGKSGKTDCSGWTLGKLLSHEGGAGYQRDRDYIRWCGFQTSFRQTHSCPDLVVAICHLCSDFMTVRLYSYFRSHMGVLFLVSQVLILQHNNQLMTSEVTWITPVILQVSGSPPALPYYSSKFPSSNQPGTKDVFCATAFPLVLFCVGQILPSETLNWT